jgi:hypothetical protein
LSGTSGFSTDERQETWAAMSMIRRLMDSRRVVGALMSEARRSFPTAFSLAEAIEIARAGLDIQVLLPD